jgi:hypothetical protein
MSDEYQPNGVEMDASDLSSTQSLQVSRRATTADASRVIESELESLLWIGALTAAAYGMVPPLAAELERFAEVLLEDQRPRARA